MINPSKIPQEILTQIFSYLPQASLLALMHSEQKLGKIAVPHLYRSLYFWGTGYADLERRRFPRSILEESHADLQPPVDATRIFDLELLIRSPEKSILLHSYIKELELTWGRADEIHEEYAATFHQLFSKRTSDGNQTILNTNETGSSEDTKSLEVTSRHLELMDEELLWRFLSLLDSSLLKRVSLTTTDLYAQLPEQVNVKSLQLKYKGEGCGDDSFLARDLNRLHQLSCIPSLEALIIDGWSYWGDSVYDVSYNVLQNARTSPILSLQISTSGCPGVDLNEVLSWPKALKAFHFDCRPHDGTRYVLPSTLSSAEFIQPLKNCHGTLEELSIRRIDDKCGAQTNQPIDLQEFPELKRLRIRSDFLLMSGYERDVRRLSAEHGNAKPIPNLTDVLPPSLEQLRLELDGEYNAYYDSSCQAISGAFYELMDQLEALAVNKPQSFPRLKDVVFGEAPHP